jgi:predicted kinase
VSTLTITRGLPGAGKTTWAKKELAEWSSSTARVNRDDLRRMLFGTPNYSVDQETLVTEVQRRAIKAALATNRDVIADDTNLPPKRVREWFRFARDNGADFHVEEFEISVEESIERQAGRPEVEQVDPEVIRNMGRFLQGGKLQPYDLSLDEKKAGGELYVPNWELPPAWIVDIDGTVALMNGRTPHQYHLVGTDVPNYPVVNLVQALMWEDYQIVFVSGRKDDCRKETEEWLRKTFGFNPEYELPLFMRKAGDNRKDSIVKRELFDAHVRNNYNVVGVLDDRNQVVEMWRELGLTCLQVAEGDF